MQLSFIVRRRRTQTNYHPVNIFCLLDFRACEIGSPPAGRNVSENFLNSMRLLNNGTGVAIKRWNTRFFKIIYWIFFYAFKVFSSTSFHRNCLLRVYIRIGIHKININLIHNNNITRTLPCVFDWIQTNIIAGNRANFQRRTNA